MYKSYYYSSFRLDPRSANLNVTIAMSRAKYTHSSDCADDIQQQHIGFRCSSFDDLTLGRIRLLKAETGQ